VRAGGDPEDRIHDSRDTSEGRNVRVLRIPDFRSVGMRGAVMPAPLLIQLDKRRA